MSENKQAAPAPNNGSGGSGGGGMTGDQLMNTAKAKYTITLLIFVCGLMLLFFIISTAIPQLKSGSTTVTFWRVKSRILGTSFSSPISDVNCSPLKTRMQAGGAFSILGIFALIGALVTLILEFLDKMPVPHVGAALTAFAWFSSMICWTVVAGVYNETHCGGRWGNGGKYGPGFGLMVFNWIFLLAALVIYVLRFLKILPDL